MNNSYLGNNQEDDIDKIVGGEMVIISSFALYTHYTPYSGVLFGSRFIES